MGTDYSHKEEGEPLWWDEVGQPRYEQFSPEEVAFNGATKAALIEITCLGCEETFRVALSACGDSFLRKAELGTLEYGPPPSSGCCSGRLPSVPLQTVEFWEEGIGGWERRRDLERALSPDWSRLPRSAEAVTLQGIGRSAQAELEYHLRRGYQKHVGQSD